MILDRLSRDFDLNPQAHKTPSQGQIKGASGKAASKILARFGEHRPFPNEGGRTNRGNIKAAERLLSALAESGIGRLSKVERNRVLQQLLEFVVDRVRDYQSRQRLKIVYDPTKTTECFFRDLLAAARQKGKEGPVAQYLVGAKLQLRFPGISVDNNSYSTADEQLGRVGDFLLGNTAFHVTVAPATGVYAKCCRNLDEGLRVYLLVSRRRLAAALEHAEMTAADRIMVLPLEAFLAQNIDELTGFVGSVTSQQLRTLLEACNSRVDEVETDKSMLIEIPRNLAQ